MKRVLLLFLVVLAISCSKDKSTQPAGKWTLVEANSMGTVSTFAPGAITFEFKRNGHFVITSTNSWDFNDMGNFTRYEILEDNRIRYYNPDLGIETMGSFDLSEGLTLWYDAARCPYHEKFTRR